MLLADPKVRCPSCGAKNATDAERCRVCTRQLPRDQAPSQAAFEAALYSRPVREAPTKAPWMSKTTLGILLIAALGWLNYQHIGWGPDWAHRDMVTRGETWRTFRSDEWSAVLPGRPEEDRVSGPWGDITRYQVGVDQDWVSVLDADIVAPALRLEGSDGLHGMVVIGDGGLQGDLRAQAGTIVAALQPDVELTEIDVTDVDTAAVGTQVRVTGRYGAGTGSLGKGTVLARLVADSGMVYVLATFVEDGEDRGLQSKLVHGFTLGDGPEAISLDR